MNHFLKKMKTQLPWEIQPDKESSTKCEKASQMFAQYKNVNTPYLYFSFHSLIHYNDNDNDNDNDNKIILFGHREKQYNVKHSRYIIMLIMLVINILVYPGDLISAL